MMMTFGAQNPHGLKGYRVTHLLANLVYFYFGCSTLCLVLPGEIG